MRDACVRAASGHGVDVVSRSRVITGWSPRGSAWTSFMYAKGPSPNAGAPRNNAGGGLRAGFSDLIIPSSATERSRATAATAGDVPGRRAEISSEISSAAAAAAAAATAFVTLSTIAPIVGNVATSETSNGTPTADCTVVTNSTAAIESIPASRSGASTLTATPPARSAATAATTAATSDAATFGDDAFGTSSIFVVAREDVGSRAVPRTDDPKPTPPTKAPSVDATSETARRASASSSSAAAEENDLTVAMSYAPRSSVATMASIARGATRPASRVPRALPALAYVSTRVERRASRIIEAAPPSNEPKANPAAFAVATSSTRPTRLRITIARDDGANTPTPPSTPSTSTANPPPRHPGSPPPPRNVARVNETVDSRALPLKRPVLLPLNTAVVAASIAIASASARTRNGRSEDPSSGRHSGPFYTSESRGGVERRQMELKGVAGGNRKRGVGGETRRAKSLRIGCIERTSAGDDAIRAASRETRVAATRARASTPPSGPSRRHDRSRRHGSVVFSREGADEGADVDQSSSPDKTTWTLVPMKANALTPAAPQAAAPPPPRGMMKMHPESPLPVHTRCDSNAAERCAFSVRRCFNGAIVRARRVVTTSRIAVVPAAASA
eukprot:30816-Pelagococcus_subviridis.AAC.2